MATPPPLQRDESHASCLRREGNGRKTTRPPPPTCLRPPKGGGCRKGGAGSSPPSPAGGAPGECMQRGQGEDKGHAACLTPQQEDKCRAACQCRACDVLTPEEGQRGRSPPPRPHLPHPPRAEARATGRRRGDKRDDGSGRRTPPPAGWGDRGTRRPCPRGARAVQAPTGDRRGCNRRKGRVTTGAARQPPPPPQWRDKCRASCLRRASDVLAQKGGQRECPPPPAPISNAHPQKGRGRRGDSERTWKKKTQSGQPRTPTRQSRDRQQGQTGQGGSQGAQQGARVSAPGDESRDAGTNEGGRGDKSPRTTLVRYPTSGVWGPPGVRIGPI